MACAGPPCGCVGASLLSAPESIAVSPGDHVVQFYDRDADLVASVGDYLVEAALEAAVSVVIATETHREAFAQHLKSRGVDPAAAQGQGSLLLLDAAATLDRFMRDGRIIGTRSSRRSAA